MFKFRYKSPLNPDTVSPLNAPAVRMGLLTKLNLLAVGLIVATALGITAFLVTQQIQDEQARLRTQGLTTASMLAELAEYAVYASNKDYLEQVLDTVAPDRDIAYVSVLDAQRKPLMSRAFGGAVPPTTELTE